MHDREVDTDVARRLAEVRARIDAAARRSGRSAGDVELVAVSKKQPLELVREAYAAGQRVFGENYAQALRDRAEATVDLPDIAWHAIGTLQRNKAKYVARVADAFHALTSIEIATALAAFRPGDPLPCFVEVNVGGEATKGGVAPYAVASLLASLRDIEEIRVIGLMALPPQGGRGWTPEASRPHFRALRRLAAEHRLDGLSMGTTEDYEVAVEEGATHVRVGRAIFGDRTAAPG
jgi:pyridoxal phosphate enzyme (YggS family)